MYIAQNYLIPGTVQVGWDLNGTECPGATLHTCAANRESCYVRKIPTILLLSTVPVAWELVGIVLNKCTHFRWYTDIGTNN
jgi:hypothetical protein